MSSGMQDNQDMERILRRDFANINFRIKGVQTLSDLTQSLKDASSFDTFSAVKDRICFNDRPSVCRYLANLDRGQHSITIRSHGDYIRGVCNRGNQCPFAILFSRRGRIDFVCSEYHKHDHSVAWEKARSETEVKLCHVENDICQLRLQKAEIKKQLAAASKCGGTVDITPLRLIENKICYRMKRRRLLRSRLIENKTALSGEV